MRERILQGATSHEWIDQAASLNLEAEAEQRQQVLMAAECEDVNLVLELVHALHVAVVHALHSHLPAVTERAQTSLVYCEDRAEAALAQEAARCPPVRCASNVVRAQLPDRA